VPNAAAPGHQAACIHVEAFDPGTGIAADETLDDRYAPSTFDHADDASAVADGGRGRERGPERRRPRDGDDDGGPSGSA
jgi:hypothetical protein